jgi:sulfonate dioxygenase
MGSVITGLQLSSLSPAAKDELALLIAEHKILTFPDQDIIDAEPAFQQSLTNHFGKANYQPVSGGLPGHPGFHVIHRHGNKDEIERFFESRTTSTLWLQDVSYEIQPQGFTVLGMLQGPEVGGDTVLAATGEAYRSAFEHSRIINSLTTFI